MEKDTAAGPSQRLAKVDGFKSKYKVGVDLGGAGRGDEEGQNLMYKILRKMKVMEHTPMS